MSMSIEQIDERLDNLFDEVKDKIWYELVSLPVEDIEKNIDNLSISYTFTPNSDKHSWDRIGLWRKESRIGHIRLK